MVTTFGRDIDCGGSALWRGLAASARAYRLAGSLVPWFGVGAFLLCALGLYFGLVAVRGDAAERLAHRILFLHVPATFMSMFLFAMMAFWSAVGLVVDSRLPGMLASALAPTGAAFTLLALGTGALWGKPSAGTWWVWDARLAAELILLVLNLAHMALHALIDDPRRADRAGAMLALAGAINVPILLFSARWWDAIAASHDLTGLLAAVVAMALAFWLYSLAVTLDRLRSIILEREGSATWAAIRVPTRP